MRGYHTFFIVLGVLVLYIFLVNFAASWFIQAPSFALFKSNGDADRGFSVGLGMSDSVSIRVMRQRFYGRIEEFAEKDRKFIFLYLFNFLKLPLRVNDLNFLFFHIAAVILLLVLFVVLTRLEHRS